MSKSLLISLKKSNVSDSSEWLSKNERFAKKTYFLYVFDSFSLVFRCIKPKSEWLLWPLFNQSLFKRVTVSDSLRLLMTKEPQERFTHFHERTALSHTKTSDSLEKPMSEFLSLAKNGCTHLIWV